MRRAAIGMPCGHEDALARLSPEGVAARAEGIAQPFPPSPIQHLNLEDSMNLDTLNAAGAALKDLGEQTVIMGYYAAGPLKVEEGYSIRLELPGTSGVHGSGRTPAEAYQNALRQRAEDAERLRIEDEVRAQVEMRRQQRLAA